MSSVDSPALASAPGQPGWRIGTYYLFRTPTWYYLARLEAVDWGGYWVSHLFEVRDTGPIMTAWAAQNPKWAGIEAYPRTVMAYIPAGGTVPIEWPHTPGE